MGINFLTVIQINNMTVAEYLKRKYTLLNTPAIIRNGKHYRLLNGQLVDEVKFKKMFVLPVTLTHKTSNPDKRKNYLGI